MALACHKQFVNFLSLWVHETCWTCHCSSYWKCGRWKNIFHFEFYEIQVVESINKAFEYCLCVFDHDFYIKETFPFHQLLYIEMVETRPWLEWMLEHWVQGLEFGCKVEGCMCECIFHYIAMFLFLYIINILTSSVVVQVFCVARGRVFVTKVQTPFKV